MNNAELESMSIKQLEKLQTGCFPGSIRYDQVSPILEAKRRRADAKRAWVVAIIASAIALLGLLISYLRIP